MIARPDALSLRLGSCCSDIKWTSIVFGACCLISASTEPSMDLPDRSHNATVKLSGDTSIATWTECLTDHPGLYSVGVR